MEKDYSKKCPKYVLLLVILTYLFLGLILLKYYRYQINPDGISYISIAKKYLAGNFCDAINGYWGPFISWLLIPFLFICSDELLVAKVLTLLIGLVSIIALYVLSFRFEMPKSVRIVILFTAIPAILSFAYSDFTPDILIMCAILCYLAVIFGPSYAEQKKNGIFCGVLGAFTYLSKSYGLPFFIVHFVIMNALYHIRGQSKEVKRKVLHNFLIGSFLFVLISGTWIGLLSNKYGYFTFSTTAKSAYSAKVIPGTKGEAILWQGFLEPPNPTAISAWEDSSFLEMPESPPMSFVEFVRNQLAVTMGLITRTAAFFMDFSVLSIAIGIGYLLFLLRRFNIKAVAPEVLYPTVTIIIYAGGYSLIWVRERYLWVLVLMMMLMGGYILGELFKNRFFTKPRRILLFIVFFLSFAIPASHSLRDYAHRGEWVYNLGRALKPLIPANSRIASNENWGGSLFLSYHLDCKYYGMQQKDISRTELNSELEKYGIEYFFVWGGAGDFSFLSNYQDITGGRIPGIRIYGLKKQGQP